MNKFKGLLGAVATSVLTVLVAVTLLQATTNTVNQIHWVPCLVLGLVVGLSVGGLLYAGNGKRQFRYGFLFGAAIGMLALGTGIHAGFGYTEGQMVGTVAAVAVLGFLTALGYRVGSTLQLFVIIKRQEIGIVEVRRPITVELGASVGEPTTAAGEAVAVTDGAPKEGAAVLADGTPKATGETAVPAVTKG